MLVKIKRLLFITMILLTGSIFYGCVEEPTIEPVKTPYAVLRIGNFTHNVDNMTVTVGGKSYDLANKSITNFFDIIPGKVPFVVTFKGSVIYEKEIELSSYQETSLLFIGDHSTVDTLNNFQTITVNEGLVYYDDAPPAGQASIQFVNALLKNMETFPPQDVPPLDVLIGDDLLFVNLPFYNPDESSAVIYGNTGMKTINFSLYNAGKPVSKASAAVDIKPNKRYLVVLSGNASDIFAPTVVETDPLPVRTK